MGKEAQKVVLVTGAASGIGRAIALAFAEEGDSVVVADIDDQKGQEVVKEAKSAGGQAAYVRLDVTRQAEWEQAVEFTVKSFGQLTTLVNNAGIGGPRKLLEDLSLEDYMKVVNVTSTSVFLGAKAAAAELKKHPGVATMVNIASIMSSVARDPPVFMGYSAAKGACQSMTRNMAVGWAKQGIRVNSVHPGYINTPILASAGYTEATLAPIVSKHPMGRLGEPEEIANAVVWLASRQSSFVTGHSLFVDGVSAFAVVGWLWKLNDPRATRPSKGVQGSLFAMTHERCPDGGLVPHYQLAVSAGSQQQLEAPPSMQTQPDQKLVLSLRGDHLEVSRESILALPESILLSLFPNGLALPQTRQLEDGSYVEEEIETYVDFDVACLDFILDFFQQAKVDFYGTPEDPRRPYVDTHDMALQSHVPLPNPLFHKQAIIILREELEYFAIPPKRPSGMSLDDDAHPAVDEEGYANQALTELKKTCGQHLLTRRSIFTALQRNVNRENNVAEQHLIDMLCMSGFGKDDEWGYRALEPNRCCVTSIALVLLKTGITFPPDQNSAPLVNNTQLGTAQKLLLFWRKPARKCWWDSSDVEAVGAPDGTTRPLKVWARRIWTLETVLI